MSTPAASPERNVPQPQPSPFTRMINVFIAPTKAFVGLDRKAGSWWVPWLLIAVCSVAFAYAVGAQVGWNQVSINELKQSPATMDKLDKLPPEQHDQQMRIVSASFKYSFWLSPVLMLIIPVIAAAVLLGTFNFGMGANLRFGAMYAVLMYGFIPFLLHTLLALVTLFAGVDPEGFRVTNPVATNPAALFGPGTSAAVYRLASALDIFNIWVIIVVGIGIAANSKVKRSTAIITVAVWYALYILLQAGIAAARG